MGYAIWDYDSRVWKRREPPVSFGVIKSTKQERWVFRVQETMTSFTAMLEEFINHTGPVRYAAVEWPQFFDSAAGHRTARHGDLTKLTYTVGYLTCVMHILRVMTVELVPVNDWKGQLPKSLVTKRIKNILGEEVCKGIDTHAWDAVGIGLYCKGHFG